MVDAFVAGMSRLFADPHLSLPVFYVGSDGFPATWARGIFSNPIGDMLTLGTLRMAAPHAALDVLQADLPDKPRRGASVVVREREWKIEEVTADERNLRWKLTLTAVPVG
jgi:hypothetical protein